MPECKRCHREFDNPVPEVTHPEGMHEIACIGWCAACNAFVMSIVGRYSSAYRVRNPVDPTRGGSKCQ